MIHIECNVNVVCGIKSISIYFFIMFNIEMHCMDGWTNGLLILNGYCIETIYLH